MATPEDEPDARRPRWLAWVIGLVAAGIALGMLNLAWLMLSGRLGPTNEERAGPAASPVQTTGAMAGRAEALPPPPASAGVCMRCHGVERKLVGPAFVDIAERYRDRADAQAYLAGKAVNGSVGQWGRVIMPRQVGVTDAMAQDLAAWIIRLAPPSAAATSAPGSPSGSGSPAVP